MLPVGWVARGHRENANSSEVRAIMSLSELCLRMPRVPFRGLALRTRSRHVDGLRTREQEI